MTKRRRLKPAQMNQDRAFEIMVKEGFIIPAKQRGPMKILRFRALNITGKPISTTISEDREDRF